MMMSLPEVARALGGQVVGVGQVLCPAPGHSHRDRSLSVRFDPRAPDGFVCHTFAAGDDPLRARDYVRARLGLGDRFGSPGSGNQRDVERRPPVQPRQDEDEGARRRRALAIWGEAREPRGTVVERYLASRALALPDEVAGAVLRYHPACPFGAERVPAMVALLRSITNDEPQGVHRTALTPEGAKVGRKMLGTARGAAVKLDGDGEVGGGLGIGEGIETCMAARELGIRPAWALGSVGGIFRFPVLPGVETLTILVETGDRGASDAAALECGTRWHRARRQVVLARPRIGSDIADALQAARSR